ncbi:MAG: hypothetical protein HON97_08255 [Polaribacter sp.]|jgi:uncharacterized protein with NRDE domain|nr:hypothetical protein [Polaribacter sp.]MBT5098877.1 hypothetical protein [Polaribacter sp.]MBT5645214.1 hypothetical protein [Polaribacter sp.]MBT7704978.1 hypothetical protein [Polaribacter sp.]
MCTVTYLPLENNQFILTSNRDESPMRRTIPPTKYDTQGVALVYPKDELAGGTWIGLSEKNRLVCLLNGGFEIHKRKGPYAMSRGLVVKKILSAENSVVCIENFIFDNIEPFTLILVDWEISLATYELVWDGVTKHFKKLAQEPEIWSSSTLYTAEMKASRRAWFADWLSENKTFQQQEIINFQTSTDKGTPETSLKMKRNFVETVSVTSVKKEKDICLIYNDILKGEISKKTIVF